MTSSNRDWATGLTVEERRQAWEAKPAITMTELQDACAVLQDQGWVGLIPMGDAIRSIIEERDEALARNAHQAQEEA